MVSPLPDDVACGVPSFAAAVLAIGAAPFAWLAMAFATRSAGRTTWGATLLGQLISASVLAAIASARQPDGWNLVLVLSAIAFTSHAATLAGRPSAVA